MSDHRSAVPTKGQKEDLLPFHSSTDNEWGIHEADSHVYISDFNRETIKLVTTQYLVTR